MACAFNNHKDDKLFGEDWQDIYLSITIFDAKNEAVRVRCVT